MATTGDLYMNSLFQIFGFAIPIDIQQLLRSVLQEY